MSFTTAIAAKVNLYKKSPQLGGSKLLYLFSASFGRTTALLPINDGHTVPF